LLTENDVSMPPTPLVRFAAVRKSFDGGGDAVRNFSLDVAQGEFLTLLGPSGSGKTTALMLLAGFEVPSAGDILLGGESLAGVPAHRRGIGVVFQGYALFPHMSVAENVGFPLVARGVRRAERRARVERALAMVRLPELADRRPAQLSGGQQQRVALARALVFGPKLVLLDEPLAALDRGLREEMQAELRRLHAALDVTLIHVTHDQTEALALSDRVAVMRGGRLLQVAAPQALYDAPASAFVARFVGENNALHGIVRRLDPDEDDLAEVRLGGGHDVRARLADAEPGAACVLMVRPERIAVARAAAADMGEHAIPATLIEAVPLGDHARLRFALAGGAEVVVTRPAAAGFGGLAPGDAAALAFSPYHAWAFRPELPDLGETR
jgi:putative spermidine/putrescine transport system ATP-binding protein